MVFSLQWSWLLKTLSCSSLGSTSCVGHNIIIYPWLTALNYRRGEPNKEQDMNQKCPCRWKQCKGWGSWASLKISGLCQYHKSITENLILMLRRIALVKAWLSKTLEPPLSLILGNPSCFSGIIQERKEQKHKTTSFTAQHMEHWSCNISGIHGNFSNCPALRDILF